MRSLTGKKIYHYSLKKGNALKCWLISHSTTYFGKRMTKSCWRAGKNAIYNIKKKSWKIIFESSLGYGRTTRVSNPSRGKRWNHSPQRSRSVLRTTHLHLQWIPGFCPGAKAADAWCWPPNSIYSGRYEWVQLHLHYPCTSLWHGQGQLYLHLSHFTHLVSIRWPDRGGHGTNDILRIHHRHRHHLAVRTDVRAFSEKPFSLKRATQPH